MMTHPYWIAAGTECNTVATEKCLEIDETWCHLAVAAAETMKPLDRQKAQEAAALAAARLLAAKAAAMTIAILLR